MKVLQILPELNIGGVERGTVDLAKYLIRHGHKAIVVSGGGKLVSRLLKAGVTHYSLPVHKKSPVSILCSISKLTKIIKQENVDIVHARSRVPALIAFFASRKANVPFITTCHGYYSKHIFSRTMGWGKFVIVPSNVIARHMMESIGLPHFRMRLIQRGVDLEKFTFLSPAFKKGKSPIVGIIGRITPLKGHTFFLRAMRQVAEFIPELKVWVVGEAPGNKKDYERQLRILTKDLGLEERVEFLGASQNIAEVLHRLHVLVLASQRPEAFGRVILEASACGVPVVSTRLGAPAEIIKDGYNGLLVSPQDEPSLAKAVLRILRNEKLAESLAANAYEKVKNEFSLELMAQRTISVYNEAREAERILVIKLSSMGDVILSVPSLRAIRKKFPKAWIAALVARRYREALQRCPYIDELITYNPESRPAELFKVSSALRKFAFDIVIDLQNNRTSHILSYLSCAPGRFGKDNGKLSFLLNHKVKPDFSLSPLKSQLETLKMLGIGSIPWRLELWPSQDDESYIERFLEDNWLGPDHVLIGLNISASFRWRSKNWPLEHFAQTVDELGKRNIRAVLTGSKADIHLGQKLKKITTARPIDAIGKTTLMQLACLIKRCQVYVSPDSAGLHVATAVSTPSVALFGPTDPQRHLQTPKDTEFVVIKKDLKCSPCYKPTCRSLRCMRQITVAEVLEAVERLLEKSNIKNQISK
jgi:lipopolysaccharide heptosyltransferase II